MAADYSGMTPIFIRGEQLLYFDQLPEAAQERARVEFISGNRQIVRQEMRGYRSIPLNRRVNDVYHIARLNRSLRRLAALERDRAATDRSILGNLSMFDSAGNYYLFSQRRFASEAAREPQQ